MFIAELGSTFFGAPDPRAVLRRVPIEAGQAGATAIKVQLFRADSLYSAERLPEAHAAARACELPIPWLEELSSLTRSHGMKFGASIFAPYLVRPAWRYLDFVKVASGDIDYLPLLEAILDCALTEPKPVLISTGASFWAEVRDAVCLFYDAGLPVVVMHCVSLYPVQSDALYRLRSLDSIKAIFPHITLGLSDHTRREVVAALAYAAGCTVFESHFAPRGTEGTPDHVVARNPDEFFAWVEAVKSAKVMLAPAAKEPDLSEWPERLRIRRGKDGLRPRAVNN